MTEDIDEEYVLLPEDFVGDLSHLKTIKANFFYINFGIGIEF